MKTTYAFILMALAGGLTVALQAVPPLSPPDDAVDRNEALDMALRQAKAIDQAFHRQVVLRHIAYSHIRAEQWQRASNVVEQMPVSERPNLYRDLVKQQAKAKARTATLPAPPDPAERILRLAESNQGDAAMKALASSTLDDRTLFRLLPELARSLARHDRPGDIDVLIARIPKDPNHAGRRAVCLAQLALVLAEEGKTEAARKNLPAVTRAITAMPDGKPDEPLTYNELKGAALSLSGQTWVRLQDLSQARADFREAVRNTVPQNLGNLVKAQAEAGDVEGAWELSWSLNGKGLGWIARVQADRGQFTDALKAVSQMRPGWRQAVARAAVGEAQASQDQPRQARQNFEAAVQFTSELPDNDSEWSRPRGLRMIARHQARSGQSADALSWAKKQATPFAQSMALVGVAEGLARK